MSDVSIFFKEPITKPDIPLGDAITSPEILLATVPSLAHTRSLWLNRLDNMIDNSVAIVEFTQRFLPLPQRTSRTTYIHFGARLRELRQRAKLSQGDLASGAGVDTSYISKLENGHVAPPSDYLLLTLAQLLNVSEDMLRLAAGRLSEELVQALTENPAALQFIQEATSSRLNTSDWNELLNNLRQINKDKLLYRR